MNEQNVDRKIKILLDLIKIYCVFLIGLITGITSILFKGGFDKSNIIFATLIIAFIFLLAIAIVLGITLLKIIKIYKKL